MWQRAFTEVGEVSRRPIAPVPPPGAGNSGPVSSGNCQMYDCPLGILNGAYMGVRTVGSALYAWLIVRPRPVEVTAAVGEMARAPRSCLADPEAPEVPAVDSTSSVRQSVPWTAPSNSTPISTTHSW